MKYKLSQNESVLYETSELYQTKDSLIYPISHPDISTLSSILPQRFGNQEIYEILLAPDRLDEIPSNAWLIDAMAITDKGCAPIEIIHHGESWKINMNKINAFIDFVKIQYTVPTESGGYYGSGGSSAGYIDYLTFTCISSNCSIAFTKAETVNGVLYYRKPTTSWQQYSEPIKLQQNEQIQMKGTFANGMGSSSKNSQFSMAGTIAASGNIMSLISEEPILTIPSDYCFYKLFENCTSLTTAPELPATTLTSNCYSSMFNGCTSLTTAPELPATTLANSCYCDMFNGCTSLTTAPELPATQLVKFCYYYMFCDCKHINYIKALFTTTPIFEFTGSWVDGVSATGTFVKNADATWDVTGTNGVPSGWTVDYPYLNFTCTSSAGSVTFTKASSVNGTLYYKKGRGGWQEYSSTINLTQGETVFMKGTFANGLATGTDSGQYSQFSMTGTIAASGNIMSLISEEPTLTIPSDYCFLMLFQGCTSLVSAPKLPATTLESGCYLGMFYGCTSLTSAPELPATTLHEDCYMGMFYGCTGLTTAPELPATTLARDCYNSMFYGCTGLTTAPELPATTLHEDCYMGMFYGCTGLTTAPELPATNLLYLCYCDMFNGCTSLTTAPELPATILENGCYDGIFENCTGLTIAPELPAKTLVTECYYNMFKGCTNLNYIKALFTTAPHYFYTQNWVDGVSATGTFVKNADATWDVTGVNGIPSGWTVETV